MADWAIRSRSQLSGPLTLVAGASMVSRRHQKVGGIVRAGRKQPQKRIGQHRKQTIFSNRHFYGQHSTLIALE
jgi:hypothetical protein